MARGGVRDGAGRRASGVDEPIVKARVGLTQTMWDYVLAQGGDNYSAGLRKIISEHMCPPAKVVEVVKEVVTAKRVPRIPAHRRTMAELKLKYVEGRWYRDGSQLNIGAIRRLKIDHPELRDAETE